MPDAVDRQSASDGEHLKLLCWGYVISGVMAGCFSVFGLFYASMGIFMGMVFSHAPISHGAKLLPAFAANLFAGIGMAIFLFTLGIAIARFWTARCISQRKSRTFCIIVAGVTCMEFPLGTALGILSLSILFRDSVIKQFATAPRS